MKKYLDESNFLRKEWDYKKNNELGMFINEISIGSHQKVWWKCEKGHSYDSTISHKLEGNGCPYCSSHRVLSGYNDLATTHPELLKEWDYKNNIVKPNEITYGSGKKVFWICNNGHSYESTIYHKIEGNGCPYCSGQKVLKGYNDLATTHPELLKEWDYKKNKIKPIEVSKGTHQKVWWICNLNHSYEASIAQRVRGCGCSYCASKKILVGYNDLFTTHSNLKKEWNYEKNIIKPTDISKGYNKKVWWKCSLGHEWEATPNERSSSNTGCPYCTNKKVLKGYNDFASHYPELLKEWDYEKNIIKPTEISRGSIKKVFWICNNGHSYESTISHRNRGDGCPYCANKKVLKGYNDLETLNPDLAKEWHPTKNENLKLDRITLKSGKKVWWKCSLGHEWQATIINRARGNRCPICVKQTQTSFPEQAIYFYIHNSYNDAINRYKDIFENGMELDIYIPSLKIGIEYDGEAFHNSNQSLEREKIKYLLCKKNKIKLIRIKENLKDKSRNCDVLLYSDYRKNNYKKLDKVINKLRKYIPNLKKINTSEDRNKIIENYFYPIHDRIIKEKPDLAKEWHPTKNGTLKLSMFTHGSSKKVWWRCSLGHEWEAVISIRFNQNTGCPYCSGQKVLKGYNDFASHYPELLKEWDYKKNKIKPTEISKSNQKKVWWKCEKGHSYEMSIFGVARGYICPYCANKKVLKGYNDLETLNPDLAKEWHPTKNGTLKPSMIILKSTKKVWWKCEKGHEWYVKPVDRVQSHTGCPYCTNKKVLKGYNDFASHYPELLKEWDYEKNSKLGIFPDSLYYKISKKVWWKCSLGHSYESTISHRNRGDGCPYCVK